MLITWRNGVSNSGGTGVWLVDGRWDGGLAKQIVPRESGFRMNQPTPDCTRWFRYEKFVGTCWGKIGACWGSVWFAANYLYIADVAISDAGQSDAWCLILTVSEYCFGAVIWWWCCQRCRIEIQRRDSDNGVVPVIMVKKGVSTKKIIGHLNFNIYPFWDSIVSDNLVVRSDSISDKSLTKYGQLPIYQLFAWTISQVIGYNDRLADNPMTILFSSKNPAK